MMEQVDSQVVGWEISNRRVKWVDRRGRWVDRGNRRVGTDSDNRGSEERWWK
jgi:hypothetical protein